LSQNDDESDFDDITLPAVDDDIVTTGAAADSSDANEYLKTLPRIVRYALLVSDGSDSAWQRLIAEIEQLCPGLASTAAWSVSRDVASGTALAAELDRRAVVDDRSEFRSLADTVRLLSLPIPRNADYSDEHRRVAKSLFHAFNNLSEDIDGDLAAKIESFCAGWACLAASSELVGRMDAHSAVVASGIVGRRLARRRVAAAKRAALKLFRAEKAERTDGAPESEASSAPPALIPPESLVVCRIDPTQLASSRMSHVIGPLKGAINTALPLARVPPLPQARERLLFEFPYASQAIDVALSELAGRTTVRLRPLLLIGDPGGGKSRFARRIGEVLGLHAWRTDSSRADGSVFAGTDRRWHTAEACHPFLAISQGKIANPLIILDEIEKSATRADYGRLWDCLLAFLEPETASRYPDPALQTILDLSCVNYIATANTADPIPPALRDRFRIIAFPKPGAADVAALLPAVLADLAGGLDRRWIAPLDGAEYAAVAACWRGGSVRSLRRFVEAILQERDRTAQRH
jgi:ATP-dependent Lon protease